MTDVRTVLFYGDSNTYGYDPRLGSSDRYHRDFRWCELVPGLTRGKWRTEEDGIPGRRIPVSEAEAGFLLRKLQRDKPDLLGVMLGTNDMLGAMEAPAASALRRMTAFLDLLREKMPAETGILLIGPPEIRGMEDESLAYAEGLCRLAADRKLLFTDSRDWHAALAFDGVHLSEGGSIRFAEGMADFLSRL